MGNQDQNDHPAWALEYLREAYWRPIEHILELLRNREICTALGCCHNEAWLIRSGRQPLRFGEETRLRNWCEQAFPEQGETDG